jgi:flagellar hook-associated protein 2
MSSIINSNFRITGLASGLDTEQIVKDLMTAERIPLTKIEQQKQLAEWRQEMYRGFTNSLRSFKEQFFDVTKRSSYLLSENLFKVFSAISDSDEFVTARGTASALEGSHTVKVIQLATADTAVSNKAVSKAISGEVSDFELSGKTINVTLDGVTRKIELSDYENLDDLIGNEENGLQKLVDDAFGLAHNGGKKITVSKSGENVVFSTSNGASRLTLTSDLEEDGLAKLGIASGATNRISTNSRLGDLAGKLDMGMTFESGKVSFTINDESFTFSESDTMAKVMDTINNSKANVNIRYNEISDTFSITAKQTGAGDNIRITETAGTFFAGIGIDSANPVTSQGVDAVVEIDGDPVTRNTNTFTINGVEYTLKKAHTAENPDDTITVTQNVDAVFDSIKLFVDEYNKLVDKFSETISEKYDRDYLPLSKEQKDEMTEKEVEKWEKQAKTGLLRNDSILSKVQSDMRMALIESVEGIGINLSAIGISSKSYLDKGKLTIDEDKLKAAIKQKPDEVKNLFIQRSDTVPNYTRNLSSSERTTRNKEQGLLFRISDILDNHISTLRDNNGRKGILLEKAGIEGDLSEFESSLAKSISSYDDKISEFMAKLAKKEENYYRQFSQLETYMNRMNSQMDWLTSQLNSMQRV